MRFIKQTIPEVILCQPKIQGDVRGYFVETFRKDLLEQAVAHPVNFVQDNESKSAQGVLRGLHFQCPPYAQSKLVRVLDGEVLDVAVDIRQGSPTFAQHVAVTLSRENQHQLFVPRGFAHGFVVLSETAIFAYKVDNYYSPECDRGFAFDDAEINIDWKLPQNKLKLSEKDQHQSNLSENVDLFDYAVNDYP